MFWQKRELETKEYKAIMNDIIAISGKLTLLEQRMDKLTNEFASLRGKLYRNIQMEQEEDAPTSVFPKSSNSKLSPFG